MGLMRLLGFERVERRGAAVSDAQGDTGGGNLLTAEHYQGAGDDSHPLPGDHAATLRAPGSGRMVVVGYVDPGNEQSAEPGERRLYSRDESGEQVAEVWLKNDGTIELSNGACGIRFNADGSVEMFGTDFEWSAQ